MKLIDFVGGNAQKKIQSHELPEYVLTIAALAAVGSIAYELASPGGRDNRTALDYGLALLIGRVK